MNQRKPEILSVFLLISFLSFSLVPNAWAEVTPDSSDDSTLDPGQRALLAKAVIVAWGVSSLFPVIGGFIDEPMPWLGVADVGVAAAYTGLLVTWDVVDQSPVSPQAWKDTFFVVSGIATGALGLLGVYFLAGKGYHWEVLVPGLVWRTSALIWELPKLMTELGASNELREQ